MNQLCYPRCYHFLIKNRKILGSVVQSFVFGIVRVCVDGKLVVMRRETLGNNIKVRDCWKGHGVNFNLLDLLVGNEYQCQGQVKTFCII